MGDLACLPHGSPLHLDWRDTRSAPRPRQRRHAPSAKPGRPGSPPLATARSAAWISRAINSSYAARVLPVIGACARCRLDPDGRLNVTKAQANHLHAGQTPVAATLSRQHITTTLRRQPQPGELAHRHTQILPRYPLEIPGSQLHNTRRSQRAPTVSNARRVPNAHEVHRRRAPTPPDASSSRRPAITPACRPQGGAAVRPEQLLSRPAASAQLAFLSIMCSNLRMERFTTQRTDDGFVVIDLANAACTPDDLAQSRPPI
jgi:hypothetical protein